MKRLLLVLALLAACSVGRAQTYLMDAYKPSEGKVFSLMPKGVDMVGGLDWRGGFLIKDNGYLKFNLGAEYENVRFVVGHQRNWNPYGDSIFDTDPTIVTVWADDVKIYDGLVRYDESPKQITAGIAGAKSLTFRVVDGPGIVAFGEITLWKKGQAPRQLTNLPASPAKTIELVKDMKPFLKEGMYCSGIGEKRAFNEIKTIKVNGTDYKYGLLANMDQALIGENPGKANFYLRRQYSKLSFIAGPVDGTTQGSGWIIVKTDGKIIYEQEIRYDDIAKQIVLDIDGCDMLSFNTVNESGNMSGGIVDIKVYPEGDAVASGFKAGSVSDTPADPRLRALPDVVKLVSQVKPYAIGSDLSKQIYDGASDYVSFSMGGTKYSEGIILYEKANVLDDNLVSYAVFDLGNEYDYVRFTAGFVGGSWVMQNDFLHVYADDELILSEKLVASSHPKEYLLPIKKCRRLRFENSGQGQFHGVSAYGLADIVVYRGEDTSKNPFVHPKPDFPHEIDLIDLSKPYVHFVSQYENARDEIFHDGSTMRKYFELDGERIYKGFALKTSINFSLDAGPLSSGSNAAAAGAAGAVAAGIAVVPVAAVGSTMIGSTLAGAAALLLLAAGGTMVNNSCAAFNTYGEYNSVTFTVACEQKNNSNMPSDFTETLLIGVNGEVVQDITIYETMEPATVTVPIGGCQQLMFWLANTNKSWSGKYIFYDIKLTKDKLPLSVPKSTRLSKTSVSAIEWDCPEKLQVKWTRPYSSGQKTLDEYLSDVSSLYSDVNKRMGLAGIEYEVHTTFLETNAGEVCKAVRLMPIGGSTTPSFSNAPRRIEFTRQQALRSLEYIKALLARLPGINQLRAGSGLEISAAAATGKMDYETVFRDSERVVFECTEALRLMEEQKTAEIDFLTWLIDNKIPSVDSKTSSETTFFCPLSEDDTLPDAGLMLVDVFYMGDY